MKHVVQLVDNKDYVERNCFQHQLFDGLKRSCRLTTVSLEDALQCGIPAADHVLSCLRMRTLARSLDQIKAALGDRLITVYDQDPWESFKASGVCNGAYARIVDALKVREFAVTTHAWKARLVHLGYPATFVRMGMLPVYCDATPSWRERDVDVGFIGQVHPYRAMLFEGLRSAGINVHVLRGGDYSKYLTSLSRIKVFVHRETGEYDVNGETIQYAEGLWAKDVEACARGCVSVRNWHPDAHFHMPESLIGNGLRMFSDDSIEEAVNVIKCALEEHEHAPDRTDRDRQECARAIMDDDAWSKAAHIITDKH